MKNVLLVSCFFLLTFNIVFANENLDVINLKDGSTLKGEIIETNEYYVIIKTSLGEIKIEKEDIKLIPVTIYLEDDNIIKGNLIRKTETTVFVETSLGSFEIELINIKKIVENTNNTESSKTDNTVKSNNDSEVGIKAIGNAMLFQQRQKKISTAIGFQALGAGLLYSEKYAMGTIMLIAENGLLISSAFVDDPKILPYLWISGIALKGINTIFTIKSVNDYNNNLASEMGITSNNEIRLKIHNDYYFLAPSAGLAYAFENDISFGTTIGWGRKNFGRIGLNFTGAFIKTTSLNATLQYESPFIIENVIGFTPKFGAGFVSDSGGDVEELQTEGPSLQIAFGFVLGGAIEFKIKKYSFFKIGYDYFLGLDDGSSNGALLATFGFKL